MRITRRSAFSGQLHTLDLPVTGEQLCRIDDGELIQAVLSHLSPEQREFLISGVTPEEWVAMFGTGEEDE